MSLFQCFEGIDWQGGDHGKWEDSTSILKHRKLGEQVWAGSVRHCVRTQTVCNVAVESSDNSHTRYLRTNYFKSHCKQITSPTSSARNEIPRHNKISDPDHDLSAQRYSNGCEVKTYTRHVQYMS